MVMDFFLDVGLERLDPHDDAYVWLWIGSWSSWKAPLTVNLRGLRHTHTHRRTETHTHTDGHT